MPVVLVEVGGVARSGHLYSDRTGIDYEYPAGRYERRIQTGERFVYQVPRVGYVGAGIIGPIRDSEAEGRLICDVLSVEYFDEPVGLKDAAGNYYEADATYWRDKVYWGQGVRPLSDERFEAILAAASSTKEPVEVASVRYADHVTARRVEEISVAVAVKEMQGRFGSNVHVMPRNNPGFDLRVGTESEPTRFVEVKGTQSPQPVFFMSSGEREFSIRNAERYTLVVVSGISLKDESHQAVAVRDGAVEGNDVTMAPSQWRGRLAGP